MISGLSNSVLNENTILFGKIFFGSIENDKIGLFKEIDDATIKISFAQTLSL